ncbi:hypothetical protein LC608_31670 [Nostoc sp. XA010]|uniref:hypothetical protein n=1 Tax=Nostoc sp. XA010 TaxID=2780407 RepID=UPI001E626F38|nr:hypothetical protein [Nostoc sp. XA010]MCC5661432.1 hypothetical protein [Nostoc sp. XA010]
MSNKSLGQAIAVWGQGKNVQNTRLVSLLKSAFKLYILPNLGFDYVAQLSAKEFSTFCYEINIYDLELGKLLETFEQAFTISLKTGKVSARTKGNYRSAINKFCKWVESQSWYIEKANALKAVISPPRISAKSLPPRKYSGARYYAIKETDLTSEIRFDLKNYKDFWSQDSYKLDLISINHKQLNTTLSEVKAKRLKQAEEELKESNYGTKPVFSKLSASYLSENEAHILRFFGWCVNIEGHNINDLYFDCITRKAFYHDYIVWLVKERNCGWSIATHILAVSLSVAKYRTFNESQKHDWSDIPLIKFLRSQISLYESLAKEEYPKIQEQKWGTKEINHQQARQVLDYLYQKCSPLDFRYKERALSSLVNQWQIYLMIKILVYAPVRQEELRNLQIGKTIKMVQDNQGISRYAVKIKNHKNANITGKARYYPLPNNLTNDITTWIQEIRPLAIQAPETIESWLVFWGHSLEKMSRLESRIDKAECDKVSNQDYLKNLKVLFKGIKNRLQAWPVAKDNAKNCDDLFFRLGRSYPEKFCTSFEEGNHSVVSVKISQAMANSTLALFGEAKFLNPHGFRNIAAKHLRMLGKNSDIEAFSAFLGHSIEIDDSYAEIITDDYELIEGFIDNWWEE